eukprot:GFUD01104480.1.p1 GENE.GFUD01104480.1~~GFUD01104480.1.p1  ORF type:complete len:102 (-),score=26.05 GFUD01104480.1:73-348(-)
MATATHYTQLCLAMTVLTITMAGTIPVGVITSDTNKWEREILRPPLLFPPFLPTMEDDPPTFLVNDPSKYRRNPNWYLRFRHRNKRDVVQH